MATIGPTNVGSAACPRMVTPALLDPPPAGTALPLPYVHRYATAKVGGVIGRLYEVGHAMKDLGRTARAVGFIVVVRG